MPINNQIPLAPIRRLIKSRGIEIVSKDSITFSVEWLESELERLVEIAKDIMLDHGRKTLYRSDLYLAAKLRRKAS